MKRGRRRSRRGDGQIVEIGDRYQARYSWTEGGVRKRKAKTFALRNEAEWWLSQSRRHGNPPEGLTVREFMATWLAGKRNVRPSTLAQYTNHVNVHIVPALGGFRLTDLRRRHVEAFVEDRLAYTYRRTPEGPVHKLSPATVGKLLVTLRSALQEAVPQDMPENPAARVKAPPHERAKVVAMTPEYAAALVAAVSGTWLEHIVRVLLGSGMRIGEAVALDQVDVQDGFVRLRKSKTTIRAVPLSADADLAIHEAIRRAPRIGPREPVFFGPRRRKGEGGQVDRLRRDSVTRALPILLAAKGLAPISPHKIRHGTATLMIRSGIPMRAVADQLGHANPSMTANTYAHVAPDQLRSAIGVLDEAVKR